MAGSLKPPGLEAGWQGDNDGEDSSGFVRGEEGSEGKRWISSWAGTNGFGLDSGLDFSKIIGPKPGLKPENNFRARLG